MLVRGSKAEYLKDQQRDLSGDPQKFWRLISTILPNKKVRSGKINMISEEDDSEVSERNTADYINEFFSTVGPKLLSNNNEQRRFYEGEEVDECQNFNTDFELLIHCREINITKSSGFADISAGLFKHAF